jgi:outer membrane lipoprotein carrier protein
LARAAFGLLLAACALLAAAPAQARPAEKSAAENAAPADFSTAEGAAAALQARYESIKSFTAAFTQTLTGSATGTTEVRSGTISFAQPGLVRWQTEKPDPELLLVGRTAVWNYFSKEGAAYKYGLDAVLDSKTMLRFVTGRARLDEDFQISTPAAPDAQGLVRLDLVPFEPETSLVQAVAWADPATALLRRVRIVDFYGNENTLEFKDIKLNVPLAPDFFDFTPPKGVDVMDETGPQPLPSSNLPQ